MTYQVSIPRLPSDLLKPSTRVHWGLIRRAKADDTDAAYAWCKTQRCLPDMPWTAVDAEVTFIVAQHRRRDRDNWSARLKGFWDGLVRAGILVDDDGETIRSMTLAWCVDKERAPATVIALAPSGGAQ